MFFQYISIRTSTVFTDISHQIILYSLMKIVSVCIIIWQPQSAIWILNVFVTCASLQVPHLMVSVTVMNNFYGHVRRFKSNLTCQNFSVQVQCPVIAAINTQCYCYKSFFPHKLCQFALLVQCNRNIYRFHSLYMCICFVHGGEHT